MTYRTPRLNDAPKPKRKKHNYVGAPAIFALEQACATVWKAFCEDAKHGGCYLVGSALESADWRDVDVRCILDDAAFAALFPQAAQSWEQDTRWLLLTVSISAWLSKQSGLPVDFQFQPATHANKVHAGQRHAIGLSCMRFAKS